MTVLELAQRYVDCHQLTPASAANYVCHAKRITAVYDLPVEMWTSAHLYELSRRLRERFTESLAAETLRRFRTMLRFAYAIDLIRNFPKDWPKIRLVQEPPEAWTIQEIRRLHDVVRRQPGRIGTVPAAQWWEALLSVAWECALRASEIFRLQWGDFDPENRALLVRPSPTSKRRAGQWRILSPDCVWALIRIRPKNAAANQPIFVWPEGKRDFFSVFRYLCVLAGIPVPRTPRQLTHRLRRTSITVAATESLELARWHAGHTNVATTLTYYVDGRFCARRVVPPLNDLDRKALPLGGRSHGVRHRGRRQKRCG